MSAAASHTVPTTDSARHKHELGFRHFASLLPRLLSQVHICFCSGQYSCKCCTTTPILVILANTPTPSSMMSGQYLLVAAVWTNKFKLLLQKNVQYGICLLYPSVCHSHRVCSCACVSLCQQLWLGTGGLQRDQDQQGEEAPDRLHSSAGTAQGSVLLSGELSVMLINPSEDPHSAEGSSRWGFLFAYPSVGILLFAALSTFHFPPKQPRQTAARPESGPERLSCLLSPSSDSRWISV